MTTVAAETLVPFRHAKRWTRLFAVYASTMPGCAVVLGLGISDGHVLPGATLTSLVLLSVGAILSVVAVSRVRLVPGGLRSGRIGNARTVADHQVARSVIRRIQNRDELTTQRHLFVLGQDGRTLLRMSDRWWTEQQLLRIARHLAAPLEVIDEAVSPAELRRTVPLQLLPQERHAWIWLLVRAAAVVGGAFLLAAVADAAL